MYKQYNLNTFILSIYFLSFNIYKIIDNKIKKDKN